MPRLASSVAVGLAALLIAGCGAGSSTGTVSGKVTVDGQPLKKGKIRFVSADGKTVAAEADITDGNYTATGVPLGEVQVQISESKVVGKMKMYDTPDSPTVDKVEEGLPPRFNVQSTLKMTVQSGSQEKNFETQRK